MLRSFIGCFVALIVVAILATGTAGAQDTTPDTDPNSDLDQGAHDGGLGEPASYADAVLNDALVKADLLGDWQRASNVSAQAALVEVEASGDYAVARDGLLTQLDVLVDKREQVQDRLEDLERISKRTEQLEDLMRAIRRELGAGQGVAELSPSSVIFQSTRFELAEIYIPEGTAATVADPVALAEQAWLAVRKDFERELLKLTRREQGKSADATIARFSRFSTQLAQVHDLVAAGKQSTVQSQFEVAALQADIVELMPAIHEMRTLKPTVIGGLTLVTVDAYIQGAAALDPACPVDWTLLAGIGRVESFHGTLGDSNVGASGALTVDILGPLLDGGATEREAAEAEAAAAAAEAEEALRIATEEAEAIAEAERAFEEMVWGDGARLEEDDAVEAAEASREPVGLAAPPRTVEESESPRFNPLIWGDDLPFDDSDDPSDLDDDVVDGEEPELKGNGFAVIEDSDNGRLDGNDRWDRAVGPMQFIPETWSYWATDGNGDGVEDPHNLYDAAAAAGRFLCRLSETRGASPQTFVLGYNSSSTYVRNVLAFADGYGAAALPQVPTG